MSSDFYNLPKGFVKIDIMTKLLRKEAMFKKLGLGHFLKQVTQYQIYAALLLDEMANIFCMEHISKELAEDMNNMYHIYCDITSQSVKLMNQMYHVSTLLT
tara:strand:- start:108 stop:410 length:303 start_codon:yes stop_codon:yes gene_type:complete